MYINGCFWTSLMYEVLHEFPEYVSNTGFFCNLYIDQIHEYMFQKLHRNVWTFAKFSNLGTEQPIEFPSFNAWGKVVFQENDFAMHSLELLGGSVMISDKKGWDLFPKAGLIRFKTIQNMRWPDVRGDSKVHIQANTEICDILYLCINFYSLKPFAIWFWFFKGGGICGDRGQSVLNDELMDWEGPLPN